MQRLLIAAGVALSIVCAVPARAHAQAFLTPYAGMTFGHDAPAKKFTTGASLTFLGHNAGVEVDLGYTPDFFSQQSAFALIAESNVTTAMASLIVGRVIGAVRPYGVFGAGVIRSRVDSTTLLNRLTANDLGVTVGVGVIGMATTRVGIRGDIRYFRSLQDPTDDGDLDLTLGKFDFWRGTIGVALRF